MTLTWTCFCLWSDWFHT